MFEELLANNMDILSSPSDMSADDVVQIALLYPETSGMFMQAQRIVKEEKQKLWIDWM